MFHLVKYDDVLKKNRPVNPTEDVFGLRSIILNGTLFDDSNIATITSLNAVITALNNLSNQVANTNNNNNVLFTSIQEEIAAIKDYMARLGNEIYLEMNDNPVEETQICSVAGQTDFSSSLMKWVYSNSIIDLEVYRGGQKIIQDTTGGILKDYIKISDNQIRLTLPALIGESITFRTIRRNLNNYPKSYFREDFNNLTGYGVSPTNRYSINTERLLAFRNGLALIYSSVYGQPIDQYEETTSRLFTVKEILVLDDVITLVNRDNPPNYRVYLTGQTGTTLTVPAYSGTNRLMIWRNGILMNKNSAGDPIDQFSYGTSTTITLGLAATVDEIFIIEFLPVEPQIFEIHTGFSGSLITLTNPTNNVNDGYLLVFKNGKLMYNKSNTSGFGSSVERYLETSVTEITLEDSANTNDWFALIYR